MHVWQRLIKNFWSSLSIAVFATALVVALPVRAATVTSANDFPSTLQNATASNHTLSFTTPTGISAGSTVTITFASVFDTSSITEDDVDVADDEVDLTTAASCAGTEQASVSVSSDIVTITICVGDGGAIAALSAVTIEIGTNATASGTGANQITNPTSVGTYFVSLAGTFGDSGSIIIPIISTGAVTVTATLPGVGGSPIIPTIDTTAPVISNIVISSVTSTSALVSWLTNESATAWLIMA